MKCCELVRPSSPFKFYRNNDCNIIAHISCIQSCNFEILAEQGDGCILREVLPYLRPQQLTTDRSQKENVSKSATGKKYLDAMVHAVTFLAGFVALAAPLYAISQGTKSRQN